MNSKGVINSSCVIDGTNIANGDITAARIADTRGGNIIGIISDYISNNRYANWHLGAAPGGINDINFIRVEQITKTFVEPKINLEGFISFRQFVFNSA